jgi:hypothetical protein
MFHNWGESNEEGRGASAQSRYDIEVKGRQQKQERKEKQHKRMIVH